MFKKLAQTTHYVIGFTPSKWVKKGVFARSRAPPTRIIFKMCESQQDRLDLRFHNRVPLHRAISNLEEVIAEKPKKSRFFRPFLAQNRPNRSDIWLILTNF